MFMGIGSEDFACHSGPHPILNITRDTDVLALPLEHGSAGQQEIDFFYYKIQFTV